MTTQGILRMLRIPCCSPMGIPKDPAYIRVLVCCKESAPAVVHGCYLCVCSLAVGYLCPSCVYALDPDVALDPSRWEQYLVGRHWPQWGAASEMASGPWEPHSWGGMAHAPDTDLGVLYHSWPSEKDMKGWDGGEQQPVWLNLTLWHKFSDLMESRLDTAVCIYLT